MSTRETLTQLLAQLSEDRLAQLLDYAQYLAWTEERQDWQRFGLGQLAHAYGENEPEYTTADLKSRNAQ
jgi:hypothetical protein